MQESYNQPFAISFNDIMCNGCASSIHEVFKEKLDSNKEESCTFDQWDNKKIWLKCSHERLPCFLQAARDAGFDAIIHDESAHHSHAPTSSILPIKKTKSALHVQQFLKALILLCQGFVLMGIMIAGLIPPVTTLLGLAITLGIAILAIVNIIFFGGPLFKRTFTRTVKTKQLEMDHLIFLAIVCSLIFALLLITMPHIFGSLAMHLDLSAPLMILGFYFLSAAIKNYVRSNTQKKAQDIAAALRSLQPSEGITLTKEEGKEYQVTRNCPISEICVNDAMLIPPKGILPCDGILESNPEGMDSALISQAHMTGETTPQHCYKGQPLYAGAINESAFSIIIKATSGKTAEGQWQPSSLDKIRDTFQTGRTDVDTLPFPEKIKRFLIPALILLALISFIVWSIVLSFPMGLVHGAVTFLAILVACCPCGISLAPVLPTSFATLSAQSRNVLIQNSSCLDRFSQVTDIVFDKSGTLCKDEGEITASFYADAADSLPLSDLVYTLEHGQEHPVARALRDTYHSGTFNSNLTVKKDFQSRGLYAEYDGKTFGIGSIAWLKNQNIPFSSEATAFQEEYESNGYSLCGFFYANKLIALHAIDFPLRDNALDTVKQLRQSGYQLHLLSGDNTVAVHNIAKKLNICDVHAQQNPEQKKQYIETLQGEQKTVLMLGDGFNDSQAISQADIGVAFGHKQASASSKASICNLGDLFFLKKLAQTTTTNIRQNYLLSLGLNLLSIIIASGILFALTGVMLSPWIASLLMLIPIIVVGINSLNYQGNATVRLHMFWQKRNFAERILITNAAIYTTLTAIGLICTAACGIKGAMLFSSALIMMGAGGCLCSLTFLTGGIGLGLTAGLLIAYLLYRSLKPKLVPNAFSVRSDAQRETHASPIDSTRGSKRLRLSRPKEELSSFSQNPDFPPSKAFPYIPS